MDSAEAIIKLQHLSPERAGKVFALIEDLADLEALENAEDLKDGREALVQIEKGRPHLESATVLYEQLRREVGLG